MGWDGMASSTMDIHSKPGTKVIFKYPENGSDYDIELNSEQLIIGDEYTVSTVHIGQSRSYVELEECPDMMFNTVSFANIKQEEKIND